MNDAIKTQLSAFVDGELADNEADLLVRRLSQDSGLRQQVAEYMAIGRAMRGQPAIPGGDSLRERVLAELGDKPVEAAGPEPARARPAIWRPVGGVAVAAGVAMIALVGLQRSGTPDADGFGTADAARAPADDTAYTVPADTGDALSQYFLSHGATSSALGANGINARLVSVRLRESEVAEEEAATAAPSGDESPQPAETP